MRATRKCLPEKIISLLLSALLFLTALNLPAAEELAQQHWLEAYLLIEQADKLAGSGENALALKEFQAAELKLAKIAADFPQWQANMVAFRLEYCRQRQIYLQNGDQSGQNKMTVKEVSRLLKLEQEKNARLQEELKEKPGKQPPPASHEQQSLDDNEIKQPQEIKEVLQQQKLQQENERLQKQVQMLQKQLQTVENNDLAWKKATAAIERLRQKLAEVLVEKDTLTEAAKQADLEQKDAQAKITVLKQQLLDAENRAKIPFNLRTTELQAEIVRLQQAQIALTEQLAEQQLAAEAAQQSRDLLAQAWEAEKQGDVAAAARRWVELAENNPSDPLPALRAAVWHQHLSDPAQTRRWADAFFARSFSDVDSLLAMFAVLLSHGQWERSLALSSWAVSLAPERADCWHAMGSVFVAAGLLPSGESQYRHALDLEPNHAPSLLALAVLLAVSEPPRLTEARDFYQRALTAGSPPEPALEKRFAAISGE